MYHTGKMLRKYRLPRDDDQQQQQQTPPTPAVPERKALSTLARLGKPAPLAFGTHRSSKSAANVPVINIPKPARVSSELSRIPPSPWGLARSPASSGSSRTATSKSSSTLTPGTPPTPISPCPGAKIDGPGDLPPWNRSVDVIWRRRILTRDAIERDDELAFEGNSTRLAAQAASPPPSHFRAGHDTPSRHAHVSRNIEDKGNAPYFALPDRVRFLVIKSVLAELDSGKAIRLNSSSFLDPVWPVNHATRGPGGGRIWSTEYFDSLGKVLTMLRSYTSVSFAMRVDVLTALFLTRRFHVVYSPFVTELTQPAAVLYMERFGAFMKWITVEVDLSRLGGNCHPSAGNMDMTKNLERVKALVKGFSEQQMKSRGFSRIQSLVVLVRRYYGFRPNGEEGTQEPRLLGHSSDDDDVAIGFDDDDDELPPQAPATSPTPPGRIPYCSDDHLSVLDPLLDLEGLVDGLCIVGTDKAYAHKLIRALWGKDLPLGIALKISKHCHYRTPSCAYPFTPGQRSVVDYGPPRGLRMVRHVSDPRKWRGLYGCALSQNVHVTEVPRGHGRSPLYKLAIKSADSASTTPAATHHRSRSVSPTKTSPSRIPVMKRKSFSGNPFLGKAHLGSPRSSEASEGGRGGALSPTTFASIVPGERRSLKPGDDGGGYRKGHWKKLSRGLSFGRRPRPCYEHGKGTVLA